MTCRVKSLGPCLTGHNVESFALHKSRRQLEEACGSMIELAAQYRETFNSEDAILVAMEEEIERLLEAKYRKRKNSAEAYVSDRVYEGKRPISPALLDALRKAHLDRPCDTEGAA